MIAALWFAALQLVCSQALVNISFDKKGELVCGGFLPGSTAAVEWSSNLADPWQGGLPGLSDIPVGPSGVITVQMPMNEPGSRFYRLRTTP